MGLLASLYGYSDGILRVGPSGYPVLTGMELTVSGPADVIVIGPLESLWRLDRAFSPSLNEGCHPSFSGVIAPARSLGLILIGAHPTRPEKRLVDVAPEQELSKLDALEVNGRDMATGRPDRDIVPLSQRLGVASVGGSDAHLFPQVGVQSTNLPLETLTFCGLASALRARATVLCASPHTSRLVSICKAHKNIVKLRLAVQASTAEEGEIVAGAAAAPAPALPDLPQR